MKLFKPLALVLILLPILAFSQKDFNYRRKINGIEKNDWHGLTIPSEVYSKINRDLSDLRLYAFAGKDTTEIPYLLKIMSEETREDVFQLPVINQSKKDGALYLTFELEKNQRVNSIDLSFEQANFFAFVKLEGSNDMKDWFDIIENQRLLSIKNENANFKVQSVSFPTSQYKYIRAAVTSDTKLKLQDASLRNTQTISGSYIDAPLKFSVREEKKQKQTVVDVKLQNYVPVSHFEIEAKNENDYYRFFTIEYVSDSTNTPKGWIKNYQTLYSGYLTSYTPNKFNVTYDLAQEIRITINNFDNAPVSVEAIKISGPEVKLVSKINPGEVFLYYGNKNASRPSYDLAYFQEKVPADLKSVTAGNEENVTEPVEQTSPLFENQIWLWSIMIVVIGLLGFFTLRMMKAKPQSA